MKKITLQKHWLKHLNSLQVDSIERLIPDLWAAHFTDIKVRINGEDKWYQADWLKHLFPSPYRTKISRRPKLFLRLKPHDCNVYEHGLEKLVIAKDGWPLELFIGRPITNFFRRILHGDHIEWKFDWEQRNKIQVNTTQPDQTS